jgi:hypothetical protein
MGLLYRERGLSFGGFQSAYLESVAFPGGVFGRVLRGKEGTFLSEDQGLLGFFGGVIERGCSLIGPEYFNNGFHDLLIKVLSISLDWSLLSLGPFRHILVEVVLVSGPSRLLVLIGSVCNMNYLITVVILLLAFVGVVPVLIVRLE